MNIDEVREAVKDFLLSSGIPTEGFILGMVRKDENGNRIQDINITLPLPVKSSETEIMEEEHERAN